MTYQTHQFCDEPTVRDAAQKAALAIPPVWPLTTSVAVNPFLGQSSEGLAQTAARLDRITGTAVTMPAEWYIQRFETGQITRDDIDTALQGVKTKDLPDVDAVLKAAQQHQSETLPCVADLATDHSGTDWPGILADRMGVWAGGFFDQGQALWSANDGQSIWDAWRSFAAHDLTPEILGLSGFAEHVTALPRSAEIALTQSVQRLGLSPEGLETYFHQQLMKLGGWAQYARHHQWQADLAGTPDHGMRDLLATQLVWQVAILDQYDDALAQDWAEICAKHATPLTVTPAQRALGILQTAADYAQQRTLAEKLVAPVENAPVDRAKVQAVFCIDVRSEVFRRAFEAQDKGVQTLGFAGFFGLAAQHHDFASDVPENRLPVLLNPGVHSVSGTDWHSHQDRTARITARATRAWGRFKLAAVSSFAFVEATGPIYVGKLIRDVFGLSGNKAPDAPKPRLTTELTLDQQVDAAETILGAMSLTKDFARIVMIAGHGANVTNNPHASALHCGACGGHSGEVNARLLAALLNDPGVRKGLQDRGITVPADTLFIGALHDTTTDQVTLYDGDQLTDNHRDDLAALRDWLGAAAKIARSERALTLPRAENQEDVAKRALNWAELRPEWGLAGCSAFIAAPRHRTTGRDLGGQSFLHSYNWQSDTDFKVLELIMTAPVVVASWISLQYYGSTVAPDVFGGGNKLLHNVTGGIGVIEGNGGTLRAGLPWQSVHDGETYQHDPLRLSVLIEAPRDAMNTILEKHPDVRELFDNGWLHLFAMDQDGHMAWRYAGDLTWVAFNQVDQNQTAAKAA
ncbi:YbcC family protein [Pseudaestuariivita rosea]|uniref:YbcC family protein n=1 Tax=Pseudaestuariivita rosea TaxID=2763263 RepID=UPI001ABB5D6C|nr:DUF2309 domain-containing protein [Pseudaestuariivita rosea]